MSLNDDVWLETARVTISDVTSGNVVNFCAITETIDIDQGEKQFDVINNLCGGRIVKHTPETETTITMEMYPLEAGTSAISTATGAWDLLYGGLMSDTANPISLSPATNDRVKHRVAILWTDSIASDDAGAQILSPTNKALRFVAAGGYFVSVKPSFTDGILKFTVQYKVPPYDSSASANILIESVDGTDTATLTVLNTYTSATKW